MDLIGGVTFIDTVSRTSHPASRLMLASRIRPAPSIVYSSRQYLSFLYEDNAFVPDSDWRAASAEELRILCGLPNSAKPESSITLIRIPDAILNSIYPRLNTLRSITELKHANDYFSRMLGLEQVVYYAHRLSSRDRDSESPWPKGALVNAPALPTVTIDNQSNRLVGLHVDNWVNSPLGERQSSPNRVVVNLGFEDRYLVYINLPLELVWRLAYGPARKDVPIFEHDLIAEFYRKNPSYPVVKLRIGPGEAYIAPTDNIIHDGSTIGMTEWDLYFSVVGYFDPHSQPAQPT